MVKLELDDRETYLTYLAVAQAVNGLMQYPDPLHEQHKLEYSNLLEVWREALELSHAKAPTPKKATHK